MAGLLVLPLFVIGGGLGIASSMFHIVLVIHLAKKLSCGIQFTFYASIIGMCVTKIIVHSAHLFYLLNCPTNFTHGTDSRPIGISTTEGMASVDNAQAAIHITHLLALVTHILACIFLPVYC